MGGKPAKAEIKSNVAECYFDILPLEVTLQICSYLDAKSVCSLSITNSQYYSSINDSPIWRYFCERDFPVKKSTLSLEGDSHRADNLKALLHKKYKRMFWL